MSPVESLPKLPPGPLATAYARALQVYAPTRRHQEVRSALERTFRSAGTAGGPQGLVIVGPTGSGKTASVLQSERWLREEMGLPPSAPSPLGIVTMTTRSSGKSLSNALLKAGGDKVATMRSQSDAESLLKDASPGMKVVGFAIDEFHHSFAAKSEKAARQMTMSVKTIFNSLAKPVIAMGIDGLEDYIDADPELRQRFESKVYLDDPRVTSREDIADMRLVLEMLHAVLPCDAECQLNTPEMLIRLLAAAQCRFGSVIYRVRKACQMAAMESRPKVTLQDFCAAYRDSAPRNRRTDEDNPFFQRIDVVKALLSQMQSEKDRRKGVE